MTSNYVSKSMSMQDEPTSSLDPDVAETIEKSLESVMKTKTVCCVTHSTRILRLFDLVYSLSSKEGLVLTN